MSFVCRALLATMVLLPATRAWGQCTSANSLWTGTLASGAASAPSNDGSFTAGTPTTYVAQGTKLFALNTETGATQYTVTFGNNVQNFPMPVPLQDGTLAIFVAGVDGWAYRIDSSGE